MQDNTGNCNYPELVGKTLKLELIFNFTLGQVTEFTLSVLKEQMSSVAFDIFGVLVKTIQNF